jgi:hypothetical protein
MRKKAVYILFIITNNFLIISYFIKIFYEQNFAF